MTGMSQRIEGIGSIIENKPEENTIVVKLPRELDHHSVAIVREEIEEAIKGIKVDSIVFDFEMTEFMDSSGIGMIIGRYREMEDNKGTIYVTNIKKNVDRIMMLSGLYKIVKKEK